jgi:hypothetical protein
MASIITADTGAVSGTAGLKQSADSSGVLALATGTGTTAVTIDASQNVGIGTSSPAYKTDVSGTFGASSVYVTGAASAYPTTGTVPVLSRADTFSGYVNGALLLQSRPTANAEIAFITGSTPSEKARIDSSGNLLVGTTSNYGGGRLDVAWDGTANAAAVRASSASFTGAGFIVYADRNTTNSTFKGLAYYNAGAGAYKFIVQDSGNVQNVNNSYGAISDIKLKENITDATPKLAQLNQVRVVNYNLIGDTNKQLGVIAQELEQVFPSMIDEEIDRDAEGNDLGTTTKSVKYSVFVPMLIKAIQEQQALITTLTERISALEAK